MRRPAPATRATVVRGLGSLAAVIATVGAVPLPATAQSPPDPRLTRLTAPSPPLVAGRIPQTVDYRWERCRRYATLVRADAPRNLWPLDDADDVARDAVDGADGTWTGTHRPTADGPLTGDQSAGSTFDGSTGITIPAAAAVLTGRTPHSVELWVRPSANDTTYRYLWSRQTTDTAGRQGTGVWTRSTGIGYERIRDGVVTRITTRRPLDPGRWYHVVATYDGTDMRLYLDGALVGTANAPQPLRDTGTPLIGAGGISGRVIGDLDDVALYDRALTARTVTLHDASAIAPPCSVIDGATEAIYRPAASDLGYTVRSTSTARRTSEPAGEAVATDETQIPVDENGAFVRPYLLTPLPGSRVAGTFDLVGDVEGLSYDRAEFLVDGVLRARIEEGPLRHTWPTSAEANGPHTVTFRVYGAGRATPVSTTVTVDVQNRSVRPAPLPLGKESIFADINEGDLAAADNLLDDVWPARGFPLPNLGWPLTWTEDPYGDVFWRYYHYGLRPLGHLLYAWRTTKDVRYRDKLIAILRSYAEYDATRGPDPMGFDNSHTAAFRAMTLVNIHAKLTADGVMPADLGLALKASLARLGAFLADPTHFEGGVNIGFNEAAALLLVAVNHPDLPGAASWRQIAVARLQELLTTAVDQDGVEVENSPFYHLYVLGLVDQIARWATQYEPVLATPYRDTARRMLRHTAYITQPNGYLPMLGATATTYLPGQDPFVYGPMADADPEFAFAFTRGRLGTPPPDGTYLFPVSGQFVMRSPLGTPANLLNQTFVTFDSGVYRTDHSDLDALGITVTSDGATVLPESGLFTFDQEPERSYFHGTRAHNTVVVDGRDQNRGGAVPGPYDTANGITWATGSSRLYPGVTHRRSVVVLRQGLVLVVDRLASTAAHDYTQTWHLPPATNAELVGGDVLVNTSTGRRLVAIRQAEPAGMTARIVSGQTSPVQQGWYSGAYGAKVPSPALEFTRSTSTALFATLIATGPYASQAATVTVSPLTNGQRVRVCAAPLAFALAVPDSVTGRIGITPQTCTGT